MSLFTESTNGACPNCGAPVTREELLVWPDGIATGICKGCHRDLLLPIKREPPIK